MTYQKLLNYNLCHNISLHDTEYRLYWFFISSILYIKIKSFEGQVQCSSMQVILNKCFSLNPEKNLVQIDLVVWEKCKKKRNF